ncbi:MAG: FkbM family methyltransferase [Vicinamibacterales bacterium]
MLKRAVISTLQPFVEDRVYTVRNGLARGLRRRGGLGFVPTFGSPSAEEAFIGRLALEGLTVFDVGGYEGIFTLFFARRVGAAGRVVTFEPNPRSHARIVENVRLNGFTNVQVRPIAIGSRPGTVALTFPADETARGSIEPAIASEIRKEKQVRTVDVQIDTLDGQIAAGLPEPDFVKIDVEGLERDVLAGMSGVIARRRPQLYIELHGADAARKLENVTAVAELLWDRGYRLHHVESDRELSTREQLTGAIRGHLYCT